MQYPYLTLAMCLRLEAAGLDMRALVYDARGLAVWGDDCRLKANKKRARAEEFMEFSL